MAVFNVAKAFGRSTGTQDYGFLIDRISILENRLSADSKLSEGDYNLLIEEAQKVYSHPGLTNAQRSNVQVKISSFEKNRSTNKIKDKGDIAAINREFKDNLIVAKEIDGNNPGEFLKAKQIFLEDKINRLNDTVNQLSTADDDVTAHMEELNTTMNEYQKITRALDVTENYQEGAAPTSDFVLYVETNNDGEIVNVDVDRDGSRSGYAKTNGVAAGFKIYGKPNRTEGDKKVFILGDKRFSGADIAIPDPTSPVGISASPLFLDDPASVGAGGFKISTSEFANIDLTQTPVQGTVRTGGWAEGSNGSLYQKGTDGGYIKYGGSMAEQKRKELNQNNERIMPLNTVHEQRINNFVNETFTEPLPEIPAESSIRPNTTGGVSQYQTPIGPEQQAAGVGGRARTPAPTPSASNTVQGVAGRTISAAKEFLGGFFR